jgi:uncharacterized Fe-S center protein
MATSQYQQEGAIRHGYTDATFGCPVIIADGFAGEDDYRVEIPRASSSRRRTSAAPSPRPMP